MLASREAAKKKEIPRMTLDDIGLNKNELKVGTSIEKLEKPPEKAEGRIVEGEPVDTAKTLVEYLKTEIKVL